VVLGCRDRPKATAAVEEVRRRSGSDRVRSSPLDLADLGSVRDFAAALAAELDRVDVLVNNAGLMLDRRTETAQGFETVFGVNHLGHFLLTDMLLDQLRAAPRGRIVVVASDAHRLAVGGLRWGDLDRHRGRYHPWRAYWPPGWRAPAWSPTRCTPVRSPPTSPVKGTPGAGCDGWSTWPDLCR
jgi:NAD(P)-dependent dehydrogenase (short-subunit alcohol dehydrogenase family)